MSGSTDCKAVLKNEEYVTKKVPVLRSMCLNGGCAKWCSQPTSGQTVDRKLFLFSRNAPAYINVNCEPARQTLSLLFDSKYKQHVLVPMVIVIIIPTSYIALDVHTLRSKNKRDDRLLISECFVSPSALPGT